jgi:epoxyqueuosine reductase
LNVQGDVVSTAAIKERARGLGFDLCGIAPATALPELSRIREWLDRGYAGEMRYLQTSAETRADIRRFLPSARSVIVTATNYYVRECAAPSSDDRPAGDGRRLKTHIARYAWGDDYHQVLAARLEALLAWMREQYAEAFDARVFVDKHHVQERVFARQAGLGWIGKNTMLIDPAIGSYTFLAGLAVSLDLPPDTPVEDQCGSCTLCIDACPTGALVDEHELDATRCISYLTIEHKGAIPDAQRAAVGEHVYGCDVCQDVCPYNLAPISTSDPAWQPKPGRADASPAELWVQSDDALHRVVAGSAMTRVSLSRLRRNLAVVLGNSRDPESGEVLGRAGAGIRRAAPSAETELVKEHVAWARETLGVR